jgi:phenylacetate-coenzyme A ligase PaaK-like adenylate-forming protein
MHERRLGRFLYLNEFVNPDSWSDSHVKRMAEEMDNFRPVTLEANPSFLARFARRATTLGLALYQPPVIVLTYEFPSRLHLRQIRRAFKSPIASSHGSTETGYVFMQCECGMAHQNTEFCRVDFQPFANEHGGPAVGRLLVTPFGNQWSALVRFSVGDLGRLAAKPCLCGRTAGLTLEAIEGRIMDITVTTDGRAVTVNQVDAAAASVPRIAAIQLTQHDRRHITVRVVSESDAGDITTATRDTFAALYGTDAEVAVQSVPELPPGPSGKHRMAICEFPVDIKQLLAVK